MSKKFYTVPTIIQAEQVDKVTVISTPSGDVTLRMDDYACTTPDGESFAVRKDAFDLLFKEM